MADENRQIYRSRNRVGNRVVNSRGARYGTRRVARVAGNKIKRGFERAFEDHFGAEIDLGEVQEILSSKEEMEDIANSKVIEPNFPVGTFLMGLSVDLIGLAQFTGFLWFATTSVSLTFKVVLLFLMFRKLKSSFTFGSKALFKSNSGPGKLLRKIFMKWFPKRLAFLAFLDSIPFLGILASDAFFVVLAHNKHKKIVLQYMAFVEAVGKTLKAFERRNPDFISSLEE